MFKSVWTPIQRGIGFGENKSPRSIIGFIKKILNDWSLEWASFLAYNFLICLLPLAITAFGILGLLFKGNRRARENLINEVVNSVDDTTLRTAVRQVADIAADSLERGAGAIFAIGIIFSIWGGSRLFVAIDKVLTIIYRVRDRSFLKQNLISIGMLILFIILFIIMFAASGAPSFLINVIPDKKGAQFAIFVAGIAISIVAAFIFYLLIYLIVPNKKMKLKHVWLGSIFAAFLLDLFIILFPLYIRRFMSSFIGLIGFAVILITFFYYFSVILILGAQINAYFFERIQPFPDGLGTFISISFEKIMSRKLLKGMFSNSK